MESAKSEPDNDQNAGSPRLRFPAAAHFSLCALTPDKCASARREAVLFHMSAKKYRDRSEFLCRAPMENAASGIDFSRCV